MVELKGTRKLVGKSSSCMDPMGGYPPGNQSISHLLETKIFPTNSIGDLLVSRRVRNNLDLFKP